MTDTTAEYLHGRFNPHFDQIPPVRIKGFRRHDLSVLLAGLDFKLGVEVGVAEGVHAQDMCESIPRLRLICVDPYISYRWKRGQNLHESHFKKAQSRLTNFDAHFWRMTSLEASRKIEDESLDFCYIDGNHEFDDCMLDLILWNRKVRPGGIIAGHDYYRFRGAGVVDAVNAFVAAHQIHEWFVCDEREVDFFWARP